MDKGFIKFLKKYGIDTSDIKRNHVQEIEIDVTGQSEKIIDIIESSSISWSSSSNHYGGAPEIVSAIADYWALLTMLYALYKACNTNVTFFVKVKDDSKPIKMLLADYLRYLADLIMKED